MSCNVRGLRDRLKRKQIFRHLHTSQVDVVFLQETHITRSLEKIIKNEWGGRVIFNHGTNQARGVAIMLAKNTDIKIQKVHKLHEGRSLIIEAKQDEKTILLCNVYVPNEDNPDFFLKVFQKIEEIDTDFAIMGGDFNVVLNPLLDKKTSSTNKQRVTKSAQTVNSFLDERNWCDVWRTFHEDQKTFTWHSRQPTVMSRLDYFITPWHNLANVTRCEISHGLLSDHAYVEIEIDFASEIRGRGFWKLNNSFLTDKDYVDTVNEIIDMADLRYNDLTRGHKWEMIKIDVAEYSMLHGKNRAHEKRILKQSLIRKLNALEKKLACINLNSDLAAKIIQKANTEIDQYKEKLAQLTRLDAQGAILHSRATWCEMAEKNTKYFFNLEKANSKAKVMKAVQTEKGHVTKEPKQVLIAQKKYYQKLYSMNKNVQFEMNIPLENKIPIDQKELLDQEITIDEIAHALKQTQWNKCPGADGITSDWYIVFFNKIKHLLLEVFNEAIAIKRIHPSSRRGIISLIPKKDRNPTLLKNWCPIILLCSDYKLLAKVISNRIKTTLDLLINKDQTGFISGRQISQNIRIAADIVEHAKCKKIYSVLILLNFEKAFDRVEYQSLYFTMEYFGFGRKIIELVKLLFTDMQLCTTNNGYS